MIEKEEDADVVVVGGGVAGVIAAVSAARAGAKTILIHDRPVLGGNASSEVRVHIGGATEHGYGYDCRETGIIEEIRLETAVHDPYNTFSWIDTQLYTICAEEPNLKVFLNTYIHEVIPEEINTKNNENNRARNYVKKIKEVRGTIQGSETRLIVKGKIFIDGTGHGTLGFLAGARFMYGREPRDEFNESLAPERRDDRILGASILFRAEKKGYPVPFTPPNWALKLDSDLLKSAGKTIPGNDSNHGIYWHSDTVGWWWIELGGDPQKYHPIYDNNRLKHDLQALCFGIWDYIKNRHPNAKVRKEAEPYELTWIGAIPGHRESRRIIGDYIMTQNDIIECKLFEDRIGYGGWSIDLHPGDFWSPEKSSMHVYCEVPYGIPFRSIYSADISNLFMASRCISVTHVAHGSTRLIGTLATIGQAAGTAAALCVRGNISPRELYNKGIKTLQQILLKNDCNLLGISNEDPQDKARDAEVISSGDYPMEFTGAHTFIPIYFPLVQRFYLPPRDGKNDGNEPGERNKSMEISMEFFIKNPNKTKMHLNGGLRRDPDRFYFRSDEDIFVFDLEIPAEFTGWVKAAIPLSQFKGDNKKKIGFTGELFDEGGNYWIYLNPPAEFSEDMVDESVFWGMNYWHWPGTRIGYYNEDSESWQVLRPGHNPYYDKLIGPRGTFNLKISPMRSPYPASNINNGLAHPFIGPNLWISKPFGKTYIPPFIRKKGISLDYIADLEGDLTNYVISIDRAKKRTYSLQYGKDLDIIELERSNGNPIGSDPEVYNKTYEFNELIGENDTIWLGLRLKKIYRINEIHFKFDTDLDNSFPHQNYHDMKIKDWPIIGKAPTCIRDADVFYREISEEFAIEESENVEGALNVMEKSKWKLFGRIRGNYMRFYILRAKDEIKSDAIMIIPRKNWGFHTFNIYEIRIY